MMGFAQCRGRFLTKVILIFMGCIFTISFLHEVINISKRSDRERLALAINSQTVPVIQYPTKAAKNSVSAEEEEEEWELDNENVPELSLILGKVKNGPAGFSNNCAKFPNLYTVRFSNVHWQIQETKAEMYYFYSAYLDMRGNQSTHPHHPYDNALIRVLGMSDVVRMNTQNSTLKVCQFWFESRQKPVFGNITEVRMTWNYMWGNRAHYFPYLITCKLPGGLREMPVSVSVVPTQCTNATNNLNILHRDRADTPSRRVPQKEFGVCVKALDFPDLKMRDKLVEWIETIRLLGADKIFFYEYFVDSEIKRILDFYETRDIIGVTQTTLPGELPNQPQLRHLYIRGRMLEKRLTELIPYNDCFYKNMYDYKYILVVDTDEIIIPVEDISWSDLLKVVIKQDIGLETYKKQPISTFCFQNFYFLDGMLDGRESDVSQIPPEFHMLRHVYRSNNSTGKRYMKCFHSTEATLGVHNHFAFFCREGKRCNRHYIDENRAQMNHYRSTCVKEIKNCTTYLLDAITDTKIWRYKDQITSRAQSVLNYVYQK